MNGPLCFIIIISGTVSHTHACAVLTEGLYPDGSGATTYCTTNTSFRLSSRLWPHYGLGQGPNNALPLTA